MKTAIEIIKILKVNGFDAYVVGGYVRDHIMGVKSSDIDIATNATPEEVFEIFEEDHIRIIPTGIEHGTVTIIHEHLNPGIGYECTTFRRDISCDGRNATVEFSQTIEEDLSRRDFTINAIAYDPIEDKYIDPFGGIEDIANRLIRCVGNPEDRFEEDHLRMLRALRFGSVLGFEIDDETWHAIIKKAFKIQNISKERIKLEFDKCFSKSDLPSNMIDDMYESGLLDFIMPELSECAGFLQNKYHKWDVLTHTMTALDAIPKEYPLIRWAILFHDLGKPGTCENYGTPEASFHCHEKLSVKIATKIIERLKFSNTEKDYINTLIDAHMFQAKEEMTDAAFRRVIAKIGPENIDALVIMKYGDRVGNGTKSSGELDIQNTRLKKRVEEILAKENAFKIKDLAINGNDIMKITGLKQGPEIGNILKDLFEKVLEDPSLNTRENLIELARIKNKDIHKDDEIK